MKKDVYPDVRIEIISEGLTKKILEESKGAAPSVYGEEKPESENLPNIDSKGKNKQMGGLLQVSNKKPTYTSIIKQAMLELRKEEQDGGSSAMSRRDTTAKAKYAGLGAGSSPGGLGDYKAESRYEASGEGPEGTSSPLFQTDAVKRSAAGGGSGTGSATRRRDPAVFQSDRPDFDMSQGPGARVGETGNTKLNIAGGDSSEETGTSKTPYKKPDFGTRMEEAIVKEVVAEFIQKQTPPMTTSATKPANMGVGQQQPVVTGAGSMKNIDKAKMNKEPAPAAKRKTAPRPRKNIEAAIMKAATLALEKAKGKQGRTIPKSRQFKQSDLGRGATTFTETTEKRSKGGRAIPKSRQFKQKPKRATGGMAETYRG